MQNLMVTFLTPPVLRINVPVSSGAGDESTCFVLEELLSMNQLCNGQHSTQHYCLQSVIFYGATHYWGAHRLDAEQWVMTDDLNCASLGSIVHSGLVTHKSIATMSEQVLTAASGGAFKGVATLELPRGTVVTILRRPAHCTVHHNTDACMRSMCPRSKLVEVSDGRHTGLVLNSALQDLSQILAPFSVEPFHNKTRSVQLVFEYDQSQVCAFSSDNNSGVDHYNKWVDGLTGKRTDPHTTNTIAPSENSNSHSASNDASIGQELDDWWIRQETADLPAVLLSSQAVSDLHVLAANDFDQAAQEALHPHERQKWLLNGRILVADGDAWHTQDKVAASSWVAAVGTTCVVSTKLAEEVEAFYGVSDVTLDADRTALFKYTVPAGPFQGCLCYVLVCQQSLTAMQSADWQSLWQGWGISGDLNLGLWGLCVALHSCKPKLQLRTYLTADRCAGLWMALDGCSSCFMEDVPGCCNQMQPTEALATAVSFLNPLLWSLMQDSRSQVALVPTCFLARILPAFADCPDTVARMTNSKHNLTSRQQITEKGGLKAADVVKVTLDAESKQVVVTGNIHLVVAASCGLLNLAYLPAELDTMPVQHSLRWAARAMCDDRYNVLTLLRPPADQPFQFEHIGVPFMNSGAIVQCQPFFTTGTSVKPRTLPAPQAPQVVEFLPVDKAIEGFTLPSAFNSILGVYLGMPEPAPPLPFVVRLSAEDSLCLADLTWDGRVYKRESNKLQSCSTTVDAEGSAVSKQVCLGTGLCLNTVCKNPRLLGRTDCGGLTMRDFSIKVDPNNPRVVDMLLCKACDKATHTLSASQSPQLSVLLPCGGSRWVGCVQVLMN
jgi:hypothetical protein